MTGVQTCALPICISVTVFYSGDGKTAIAEAAESLEAGVRYALYGEAKDENGNTLTFSVPFIGFNETD